jgi:hypothetical protein
MKQSQDSANQPAENTTRREFVKATATAASALAVPYFVSSKCFASADHPAPSDKLVMAGIGIGNMGSGDQGDFLSRPEVQYVAVCDVKKGKRDDAKNRADQHYHNKDCKQYVDFREVLARPDIDAVHVATPDHWHALVVIEACRQGKDVYCQKPETRTLREGPLMIEAARRYARVVSGGSQRVMEDYRDIVNKCWSGELGTIKSINVNVGPLSQPCNLVAEPVPADIDWEMWLGPAPWAPYNHQRCDGNFSTSGGSWRSYIDYSGGGMTDWGAHHFGGACFAVDVRELQPKEVEYHNEKGAKWLTYHYPNGLQLTHNRPGKGNLQVEGTPGEKKAPKAVPTYKGPWNNIHGDFLYCVKNREKPFRDIERAVNSVCLSHLGIICYALERNLKWDSAKQEFTGDEEANRMVDRARREPWQL